MQRALSGFTRVQIGVLGLVAGALLVLGLQEGAAGALWPDVIDAFDVSKGAFGFASGVGLCVAFPLLLYGSRITTLFDKRALIGIGGLLIMVAFVGLMGGKGLLILSLLMMSRGIGVCLLDLAANVLTMQLETSSGKHLMSPIHSGYSGGTVVGAGIAWIVFALGGGFRLIFVFLAAALLTFGGFAARECMRHKMPRTRTEVAGSSTLSIELFRVSEIRLLTVITAVAFCGELLIAQWIGIYLRDEQHHSASSGARAVILLGAAMFAGRLLNIPITAKLTPKRALYVQGAILAVGGAMIVGSESAALTIIGCGVAGVGLAGMAPTALNLAGAAMPNNPGAASGAALIGGYGSLALMPFIAGAVAALVSVRLVLCVEVVFGVVVVLVAYRMSHRHPHEAGLVTT